MASAGQRTSLGKKVISSERGKGERECEMHRKEAGKQGGAEMSLEEEEGTYARAWMGLSTSGGFDRAAGARGGTAGVLGGVARSEEVPSVARKVRSYPKGRLVHRTRRTDFWVHCEFLALSGSLWLSGCLWMSLWVDGWLRKRTVGCAEVVSGLGAGLKIGKLLWRGRSWVLLGCLWFVLCFWSL